MTVSTHKSFWGPEESFKTGSDQKRQNMALYVEWLLTPESEREPKTKTAFAESLDVTLQTLRNYAREPYVQREITERARKVAKVDKLPDVLQSLHRIVLGENADGGIHYNRFGELVVPNAGASVSAAKVILEWIDKTSAVREVEVDLEGMSDQDVIGLALEVLQRVGTKESG